MVWLVGMADIDSPPPKSKAKQEPPVEENTAEENATGELVIFQRALEIKTLILALAIFSAQCISRNNSYQVVNYD